MLTEKVHIWKVPSDVIVGIDFTEAFSIIEYLVSTGVPRDQLKATIREIANGILFPVVESKGGFPVWVMRNSTRAYREFAIFHLGMAPQEVCAAVEGSCVWRVFLWIWIYYS